MTDGLQDQGATYLVNDPRYEKIRDLGNGSFGVVVLARDKQTLEEVAIKFIPRGERITNYVLTEILNHRGLYHPHVVQFYRVFLTRESLGIVMEFAPGGNLLQYVRERNGLVEDEARWFFQQIVFALDYCHRKGVVNRDLKLENTLLDSTLLDSRMPLVKMCDFGYSKNVDLQSAPNSRVGTPAYLAPEVILSREGQRYNGCWADVWSCGVMLYVMLIGCHPFERHEDRIHGNTGRLNRLIERIVNNDYYFPTEKVLSPEVQDLIQRILVTNPAQRLTIDGIYNHPWFRFGLPEGSLGFNENMDPLPDWLPSEEDVRRIVEEARQPPPLDPIDPYIDDVIDQYHSDDYAVYQHG